MLRICGHRVVLQEFSEENLNDPRYFAWLRDPEVMRTIYRLEYLMPIQYSQIEKYVQGLWASGNDCYFALYTAATENFVGTVRLGHIDWRTGLADVGILIGDRTVWGQGLATDAIRTACHYGFGELSLRKITGGTPSVNTGMIRCFEKVGFREEGRLRKQLLISGEYCDHVLFGVFKSELKVAGNE